MASSIPSVPEVGEVGRLGSEAPGRGEQEGGEGGEKEEEAAGRETKKGEENGESVGRTSVEGEFVQPQSYGQRGSSMGVTAMERLTTTRSDPSVENQQQEQQQQHARLSGGGGGGSDGFVSGNMGIGGAGDIVGSHSVHNIVRGGDLGLNTLGMHLAGCMADSSESGSAAGSTPRASTPATGVGFLGGGEGAHLLGVQDQQQLYQQPPGLMVLQQQQQQGQQQHQQMMLSKNNSDNNSNSNVGNSNINSEVGISSQSEQQNQRQSVEGSTVDGILSPNENNNVATSCDNPSTASASITSPVPPVGSAIGGGEMMNSSPQLVPHGQPLPQQLGGMYGSNQPIPPQQMQQHLQRQQYMQNLMMQQQQIMPMPMMGPGMFGPPMTNAPGSQLGGMGGPMFGYMGMPRMGQAVGMNMGGPGDIYERAMMAASVSPSQPPRGVNYGDGGNVDAREQERIQSQVHGQKTPKTKSGNDANAENSKRGLSNPSLVGPASPFRRKPSHMQGPCSAGPSMPITPPVVGAPHGKGLPNGGYPSLPGFPPLSATGRERVEGMMSHLYNSSTPPVPQPRGRGRPPGPSHRPQQHQHGRYAPHQIHRPHPGMVMSPSGLCAPPSGMGRGSPATESQRGRKRRGSAGAVAIKRRALVNHNCQYWAGKLLKPVPISARKSQKSTFTYPSAKVVLGDSHSYDVSPSELEALIQKNRSLWCKEEVLVPVRLDLELEGHRLNDAFMWNKNEQAMTPEQFAEILCENQTLPSSSFVPAIANAIREQVDAHVDLPSHEGEGDGRVLLNLRVHVGKTLLQDKVEWDTNCPRNSPEIFAIRLASELGLGGEFPNAIAIAIREQLTTRSQLEGVVNAYTVEVPPISGKGLPLRSRDGLSDWGPRLETLTDKDIEKMKQVQERTARRLRRQNRLGGDLVGSGTSINTAGVYQEGVASSMDNIDDVGGDGDYSESRRPTRSSRRLRR
eukprot:Nk52_evm1s559 gene=Nk52_evmTU1s559